MKGLVFDTSIWIEYFRGNPEFFDTCQTLLENGEVFGLELIITELLQGARGKREIDLILAYFSMVTSLDEPFLIIESGLLSHKSDFVHHGVGLIDDLAAKMRGVSPEILSVLPSSRKFASKPTPPWPVNNTQ